MIGSRIGHTQINNYKNTYILRKIRYKYNLITYKGADKSLARPGREQATATEDFDIHVSYL